MTTLAGTPGSRGYSGDRGAAARAQLSFPWGVATNGSNIYWTESGNSVVRMMTANGIISTLAGLATARGCTDGPASRATLGKPAGLTLVNDDTLVFADVDCHAVRQLKISTGTITTIAPRIVTNGNRPSTASGLSIPSGAADGSAATARFNSPTDVAYDALRNRYYVAGKTLALMFCAVSFTYACNFA